MSKKSWKYMKWPKSSIMGKKAKLVTKQKMQNRKKQNTLKKTEIRNEIKVENMKWPKKAYKTKCVKMPGIWNGLKSRKYKIA